MSLIKQLNEQPEVEQKEEVTPTEEPKVEEPKEEAEEVTPPAVEEKKDVNALQVFFESRDQVHYWHLQTTSYAEHVALNTYYDEFLALADDFIEVLQGVTGERASGSVSIQLVDYTEGCSVKHLTELKDNIATIYESVSAYSDLTNILDEMYALINKTIYLLSLK
jgi:hypothetical protein